MLTNSVPPSGLNVAPANSSPYRGAWGGAFRTSRFWRSLRGRFVPGVNETALPLAALERLGDVDDELSSVVALLRLLQPISTTPGLEASAS